MEQVKKILDWLTAGDVQDREVRLAIRRARAAEKRVVDKKGGGFGQEMASASKPSSYRSNSQSQVRVK